MDSGYAPLNDKTRAWILAAAKNDEDSLRRLLNENPEIYRHSLIYAVNVWTQIKNRESKNRVNRGYLEELKGRKIG